MADFQGNIDFVKNSKITDTIILLHGLGQNLCIWDTIVPFFSTDYHVLRYDLRGHGQSTAALVTWSELCADIDRMVRTYNIDQFHLVGYGFGCNIAAVYAHSQPQWDGTITLISPHYFQPPVLQQKLISYERQLFEASSATEWAQISMLKPLTTTEANNLMHAYRNADVETYLEMLELAACFSLTPGIRQPVLALSGQFDCLFPPFFVEMNTSIFPALRHFTVPEAAMMTFIDQPELTFQWVDQFIKQYKSLAISPLTIEGEYRSFQIDRKNYIADVLSGLHMSHEENGIRLEIFGTFKVAINGYALLTGWNERSAKKLFVYLAFHPNVTREQACADLWPEMAPNKSRANLRVYIHHLKKLLEYHGFANMLSVDRNQIQLNGRIQSDVAELLKELEMAYHEKKLEKKKELCINIFTLLPKSLYTGIYDNWMLTLMERIEFLLEEMVDWLAQYYSAQDKFLTAVHYLKMFLKFAIDREGTYDQIISLYEKANRSKEASQWKARKEKYLSKNKGE